MIRAFAIRDDYWFPGGDIDVNPKQGAPSGYTFTDPRPLNPNADQWVKRTNGNSPFWELTTVMPPWDVVTYQKRLADAKLTKRREIEADFADRLTLGMAYDFGTDGIAVKTPLDGQTVNLRRYDQTIIQEIIIDASDGFLHIQARAAGRANFAGIEQALTKLATVIPSPSINFVMAENIAIALDITLWNQIYLVLLQWYSAIFTEFGGYKSAIENSNSIEFVNSYTWTWNN